MQILSKIFLFGCLIWANVANAQVIFSKPKTDSSKFDSLPVKNSGIIITQLGGKKKEVETSESVELVNADTLSYKLANAWLDSLVSLELTLDDLSKKNLRASSTADKFINLPSIWPLKKAVITSSFGLRVDPITGNKTFHGGIDLAAPSGTPVYSTARGVVEKVVLDHNSGGLSVYISHSSGYSTIYSHLGGFEVSIGETVKRGQQIGLVGSTGRSTGPHLHYIVVLNGKAVDPLPLAMLSKSYKQPANTKTVSNKKPFNKN